MVDDDLTRRYARTDEQPQPWDASGALIEMVFTFGGLAAILFVILVLGRA